MRAPRWSSGRSPRSRPTRSSCAAARRSPPALDEVKQKGFAPVHVLDGRRVVALPRRPRHGRRPRCRRACRPRRSSRCRRSCSSCPEGFTRAPEGAADRSQQRHDRLVAGEPFDWGTGEMLAYASLLAEKTPVRHLRPGRAARHLQPPPRGAARRRHGRAVRAAVARGRAAGALRGLQQPAAARRACSASSSATASTTRTRW